MLNIVLRIVGFVLLLFVIAWIWGLLGSSFSQAGKQWSLGGLRLPSFAAGAPSVSSAFDRAVDAEQQKIAAERSAQSAAADAKAAQLADSLKLASLTGAPRLGDQIVVQVFSDAANRAASAAGTAPSTVACRIGISANGQPEEVYDIPAGSQYGPMPAVQGIQYSVGAVDLATGHSARTQVTFGGGTKVLTLTVP